MNCHLFSKHVAQLVRGEMIESRLVAECQDHASLCAPCHYRLVGEESLQRAFRALVESDREVNAPAIVEERLLLALRSGKDMAPPSQSGAAGFPWRMAAAAVLLVSVGFAIRSFNSVSAPTTSAQNGSQTVTLPSGQVSEKATVPFAAVSEVTRPAQSEPAAGTLSATRTARRARRTAAPRVYDETDEIMTDFLLLNEAQNFYPMDRGSVVRVLVPRSTLGAFGLPTNPERGMTPVKADLVVGEDGMAHAIRFIR